MKNMEAEIETDDRIHPSNSELQTDDKISDGLNPSVPNGPPAISRLLKEILFHVFIVLRDDEYSLMDDDESWSRHARRHDWIAVTHVCSKWRTVCLGYPLLWNRIVNRLHDTWIMVFVQRSAGAPLDVSVKFWRHGRHVADSLIAQVSRWRRINIDTGDGERLSHLLDEIVRAPHAPHLESFCLRSRDFDNMGGSIDEQKIPFPSIAFSGHTPKLRHLALERPLYPIPGSPMLSSLTSLVIPSSFTQDSILALLASAPNLTILRIIPRLPEHFINIPIEQRAPFTIRPVRLNDLHTLILNSHQSDNLLGILQNLQLPSLQRLFYSCLALGEISEAMLKALSTHAQVIQSNKGPIHALSLSTFDWGTAAITGWSSAQLEAARASNWRLNPFVPMESGHKAFIHVQHDSSYNLYPCSKFSSMLQLLRLSGSSVRELRINRTASLTRAQWHAAFRSFDAVEVLEFHQCFEDYLSNPDSCTIFKAATPEGTDGLFPRLRKIIYSFDRRLMHGGVSQSLWRLAESKKAAGSPLEVNFRDVGDYDAKIEATLGKIAKVTWGEQDTAG